MSQGHPSDLVSFEFQMTRAQRDRLHALAKDQNLAAQEFLELLVFNELRPRQRARRRPMRQTEVLPIAG